MFDEVFRTIPGFGDYQVSNLGRVRSRRSGQWKLMKGGYVQGRLGYRRFTLFSDKGVKGSAYLHQLVLKTFDPWKAGYGPWVLHKDGNAYNNVLDNLYWGDPAQNVKDKMEHGWSAKGDINPNSKLTEVDVHYIRSVAKTKGFTYRDLSLRYGVSTQQIFRIVSRECWNHI